MFINLSIRAFVLLSAVVVGLNILPLYGRVGLGVAVFVVTGVRFGWMPVLISVVLFGYPFTASCAAIIGVTPTNFVMFLDVVLGLTLLKEGGALFTGPLGNPLRQFTVWWLGFLFLYTVYFFLGPQTEYSVYCWQYFFILGNLNALAAVLTIKHRIPVTAVLMTAGLWFSYMYPFLDSSFLSISSIVDDEIGLRSSSVFDPITGARTAGFLMISAVCVYLFEESRLKYLPEIALAFAVSAPLAWFSYTRQVWGAIVLVSGIAILYILFRREKASSAVKVSLIGSFFAAAIIATTVFSKFIAALSNSRVVEDGYKLNRTSLWEVCLNMALQDPVMGGGVGSFALTGIAVWPHNWILEAWLELGLLGLLFSIVASAFILIAPFKGKDDQMAAWSFLGLYYIIVVQISGDIPRNSSIIFFIAMALYLYSAKGVAIDRGIPAVPTQRPKFNFVQH